MKAIEETFLRQRLRELQAERDILANALRAVVESGHYMDNCECVVCREAREIVNGAK